MRDFPIQTGLCIATLGALLAAMKYHPLDIEALSAFPTTLAPAAAVTSPCISTMITLSPILRTGIVTLLWFIESPLYALTFALISASALASSG